MWSSCKSPHNSPSYRVRVVKNAKLGSEGRRGKNKRVPLGPQDHSNWSYSLWISWYPSHSPTPLKMVKPVKEKQIVHNTNTQTKQLWNSHFRSLRACTIDIEREMSGCSDEVVPDQTLSPLSEIPKRSQWWYFYSHLPHQLSEDKMTGQILLVA